MLVTLHAKDSYTPTRPERCDDYQNNFISRVVFDTESQLYFVFQSWRGTMGDNEIDIHVTKNKEAFSFEYDVIRHENVAHYIYKVDRGVLQVFDKVVEKIIQDTKKALNVRVKEEKTLIEDTLKAILDVENKGKKYPKDYLYDKDEYLKILNKRYITQNTFPNGVRE